MSRAVVWRGRADGPDWRMRCLALAGLLSRALRRAVARREFDENPRYADRAASTWAQLDGWADDDHAAAFAAFLTSCQAILKRQIRAAHGRPIDLALCEDLPRYAAAPDLPESDARAFLRENFRPVRIAKLGEADGFLTGYYEPIVDGSRVPTDGLHRAALSPAADLASPECSAPGVSFPNTRRVIAASRRARRACRTTTAPQIDDGALDGRNLEICWLKDSDRCLLRSTSRARRACGSTTARCCG